MIGNNNVNMGNIYGADVFGETNSQAAGVNSTGDGQMAATSDGGEAKLQNAVGVGGSGAVGFLTLLGVFLALYAVLWWTGKREDFALIMPGLGNIIIIGLCAALFILGGKVIFTTWPVRHVTQAFMAI